MRACFGAWDCTPQPTCCRRPSPTWTAVSTATIAAAISCATTSLVKDRVGNGARKGERSAPTKRSVVKACAGWLPHSSRHQTTLDNCRSMSLERDDFSSNHHLALAYWWSMIFSENRYPLFGIML